MSLTLGLLLLVAPASGGSPASALAFAGGWFDYSRQQDQAAEFRIEFRHGGLPRLLGGVAVTSDGALYAWAGLGADIFLLRRRLVVTPSFSPVFYAQRGGKDLGYPLEFRSQVEVSYRFREGSRLGLSVSHISNAGLGEINPGGDSLMLVYERPLGRRSRRASP